MKIKLSDGNHKLDRRIKCWSLPPIKTCPNSTPECEKYCYALKAWKQYPNVRKAWNRNWEQSKKAEFVDSMIKRINRYRKLTAIRIHVSGDFYSQDYFDKWVKIAKKLPNVKFYTYTRVNGLNLNKKPDNFIVILSEDDYKNPDKFKEQGFDGVSKVVEDSSDVKDDEFLCPYHNGTGCGNQADQCNYCIKDSDFKKVVFLKH